MTCNCNPCLVSNANTTACESLPSALENFILQFFGQLEKTEVNGAVTWVLPCDLDVGLQNNPRLPGEGLGCYLLRLLNDGVVGLTGPQGDQGDAGEDGNNAYTVTLQGFAQPAVGASITVKLAASPVPKVGMHVFVEGSGWHRIDELGADSTFVLTLIEGIAGVAPGNTIAAGKVVTVSGPRGATGPQGATGAKGDKGDKGDAGAAYTTTNGFVLCEGADYAVQVTYNPVTFAGENPEVTLPQPGTYMLHVTVAVELDETAAAAPGEEIWIKLYHQNNGTDVPDSERMVKCFLPEQTGQVTLTVPVTVAGQNHTIKLYAKCSQADKVFIVPEQTTLFYMMLSPALIT